MNPWLVGAFMAGAGWIAGRAWLIYRLRGTRGQRLAWEAEIAEALALAGDTTDDVPPETVDRMRHVVQAEAWVMSQTPIADRLAEERFRKQLEDGRPSWLS